jgi:hypothetical protein
MDESLNSDISVEEIQSSAGFFIIDRRTWRAVCRLGIHEAVAYLVLARGTLRDNRTTQWSKNAIQTHTGLAFNRAQQAIKRLCDEGFVRQMKAGTRPRYRLMNWPDIRAGRRDRNLANLNECDRSVFQQIERRDWPRNVSDSFRISIQLLCDIGLLNDREDGYTAVFPEGEDAQAEDLIWLPNALVSGTPNGEDSPLKRVRRSGNIWTLRLLVELYHAHSLRDDYGIERSVTYQKFERRKVGERSCYTIWGFESGNRFFMHDRRFAAHWSRPTREEKDHPVWDDLTCLTKQGLLDKTGLA